MKKIAVVFGGSGFLGSHVVECLVSDYWQVRVFDRSDPQSIESEIDFIAGDVLDFECVYRAVESADVVFNFAALADLNDGLDKPMETLKVNVEGHLNILEASRMQNVGRIMYASTVYVNSRQGGFYRCSKIAAENYLEEYSARYGLKYTILRFGSLYGPRSNRSNGLYRIVEEALETGQCKYRGSPEAVREYIHVIDAARSCVDLIAGEFENQTIVLTGNQSIKVLDLLNMLNEILGYESCPEILVEENVGHYVWTANAYKPRVSLKYNPKTFIDFSQGLLSLIEEIDGSISKTNGK